MNGAAWLLIMSTLGVDFGWRVAPDGKLEYIIQIPDAQYERIRVNPEGVDSNIPPEVVRHVQRIRVIVGESQLPRDPLPTGNQSLDFAPGSTGNQRFRSRGVGLPAGGNDFVPGVGQSQESNVIPLEDDLNRPNSGLPGPGTDVPFENRDSNYTIPPPPISRASTDVPDFGDFGTGRAPQAIIRRNSLDVSNWQPNTSAPSFYDGGPTHGFGDNARFQDRQANYNTASTQPFGTANRFGIDNRSGLTDPRTPSTTAVGFTVLALLFSIGLNLFLGWLAWEYYLKYRESFESWRSSAR